MRWLSIEYERKVSEVGNACGDDYRVSYNSRMWFGNRKSGRGADTTGDNVEQFLIAGPWRRRDSAEPYSVVRTIKIKRISIEEMVQQNHNTTYRVLELNRRFSYFHPNL